MDVLDEPIPLQSPSQLSTYELFQAAEVSQQLFIHQNGLCIIRLAPRHPALQRLSAGSAATASRHADAQRQAAQSVPAAAAAAAAVAVADGCTVAQEPAATAAEAPAAAEPYASISFDAGRQNLLHVQMRKGRGPMLAPDSALCNLIVDGVRYTLRCCVRGALVDANAALEGLCNMQLLRHLADEYIAIVELRAGELERLRRAASTMAAADFDATLVAADAARAAGKDVAGEVAKLNSEAPQ